MKSRSFITIILAAVTLAAFGAASYTFKPNRIRDPQRMFLPREEIAADRGPVDYKPFRLYGRNTAVSAGWELIHSTDATKYNNDITSYEYLFQRPVGGGGRVFATSSSDADNPAGFGAWVIQVWGLDSDLDYAESVIVMNGTNDTESSSATFLRLNGAIVILDGEGPIGDAIGAEDANIGNIEIYQDAGDHSASPLLAEIFAGKGQTEMGWQSVPRYRTAVLTRARYESDTAASLTTIKLWKAERLETVSTHYEPPIEIREFLELTGTVQELVFDPPFVVNGPADIWATCFGVSGTGEVSFEVSGYTIPNPPDTIVRPTRTPFPTASPSTTPTPTASPSPSPSPSPSASPNPTATP